ncbi:hypothetical protein D3C81_908740 [compost metagenome]
MEKVKVGYQKALEAIEKQKGTIERHEKALTKMIDKLNKTGLDVTADVDVLQAAKFSGEGEARKATPQYWDLCSAVGKMEDIKNAQKKLKEREAIADGWYDKLSKYEKQQAVFAELPQIILDWAEAYRKRVIGWLMEGVENYFADLKKAEAVEDPTERRAALKKFRLGYGGTISRLVTFPSYERPTEVERLALRQKNDLLAMMVYRVTEETGKLTDASGLHIGSNGEINGLVVGEKGSAVIETILAGGYNIQCLHFRVLVKPVK